MQLPTELKVLQTHSLTLSTSCTFEFLDDKNRKGTRIVEYQGEVLTWKEGGKMADDRNRHVFYFTAKFVFDAWNYKKAHARYINDAKGITRIEGVKNNTEFELLCMGDMGGMKGFYMRMNE